MAPRLQTRSLARLQPSSSLITITVQRQPPFTFLLPRTAKRGVKYGWTTAPPRNKHKRFNQPSAGLPLPTAGPAAALARKERTTPVRTGVLAIKKGMSGFFTRKGVRMPCTVLQLDQVQVVACKTRASNGYWAVQVGLGSRRPVAVPAPMLGYYEAKGVAPKEHLAEFRVRGEAGLLPVGVELRPDWFHKGQWVDVRSNSRGQGFAGGMKRHGFKGQGASHGNSKNHRTGGSLGPSQGSGSRVHPGKKMPGRMGNERVTVQNLPVLKIDNELGIVVVKGCVAGPKGCLVKIQDAVKKPPPPEKFIVKTRQVLEERFPNAAERLEEARRRHLVLKEARRNGSIDEAVAAGFAA